MLNPDLERLRPYPFEQLATLFAGLHAPKTQRRFPYQSENRNMHLHSLYSMRSRKTSI